MQQPHIIQTLDDFKNKQSNYGAYLESARSHIIKAYFNLCGYNTLASDIDGNDCDFAIQLPTNNIIKIQLKARPTCNEKYLGHDLYIMCPLNAATDHMYDERYVILPHDDLYDFVFNQKKYTNSKANAYSFVQTRQDYIPELEKMSIIPPFSPIKEIKKAKSYL